MQRSDGGNMEIFILFIYFGGAKDCQERLPLEDDLGGENKGTQGMRGKKAPQAEGPGSTKGPEAREMEIF